MSKYTFTKEDFNIIADLLADINIKIPEDRKTNKAKKQWLDSYMLMNNITSKRKSVFAIQQAIKKYVDEQKTPIKEDEELDYEAAYGDDDLQNYQMYDDGMDFGEPTADDYHRHDAAMSELRQRHRTKVFGGELTKELARREELRHTREQHEEKTSKVLEALRDRYNTQSDDDHINYQTIHHLRQVRREATYKRIIKDIDEWSFETDYKIDLSDADLLNVDQLTTLNNSLKTWIETKLTPLAKYPPEYYVLVKLQTSKGTTPFRQWMLTPKTITEMRQAVDKNDFLMKYYEQDDFKSDQSEKAFPDWDLVRYIQIIKMSEKSKAKMAYQYQRRDGSFLPMVPTDKVSYPVLKELEKCQIFKNLNYAQSKLKKCCWVYAFEMAGVEEHILLQLMNRITDRNILTEKAIDVMKEFGYNVHVRSVDRSLTKAHQTTIIKKDSKDSDLKEITINLYRKHYFLDFKTDITKAYLEHMGEVNSYYSSYYYEPSSKRWKKVNKETKSKYFLSSWELLERLIEKGYLRDMTPEELLMVPLIEHPKIDDFESLEYSEKYCITDSSKRHPSIKSKEVDTRTIFFGDTEADTSGDYHRPFLFTVFDWEGNKHTFRGEDCIEQGLDTLPDKAIVYFYNLGYDSKFFVKYASGELIGKGHKDYSVSLKYASKTITLKDAMALIPLPGGISAFPKSFKLEAGDKECFPYDYYTLQRLESNVGIISEAMEHVHKNRENFIPNIDKIPGCRTSPSTFDMYVYATFYCEQDVRILQQGFKCFRDMVLKLFDIDVLHVLTAPSLAHIVFFKAVYSNPKIKALGGLPSMFIRKCIHGGRVMPKLNRAWHTVSRIIDFDAVSLYPSAMARLRIPYGVPKVLPESLRNWESLKKLSEQENFGAYFVKCTFQPVSKHRDFPLFVYENEDDGTNSWDDTFTEPITIYCSHIMLEDIVKYYNLKESNFRIVCGYYFNEGVDTQIQEEITKIFNERKRYQKLKDPMEKVLKLIMNSAYGKTIQKFITTTKRYMSKEDGDTYLLRHWNENPCLEGYSENGTCCITTPKEINNQFTYCTVGALILDMSKRIMNEVMTLAEDIGCRIYYQDTDSMHILEEDIPKLEAAFEETYHRKLVGEEMGQFHCDFDSCDGLDEASMVSVEAYFIGKKVYIDKLQDKYLNTGYHVRMKGISKEAIYDVANHLEGGVIRLYKYLFETDNELEFNLLAGHKPSFEFDDFMVSSRRSMLRRIRRLIPRGSA